MVHNRRYDSDGAETGGPGMERTTSGDQVCAQPHMAPLAGETTRHTGSPGGTDGPGGTMPSGVGVTSKTSGIGATSKTSGIGDTSKTSGR